MLRAWFGKIRARDWLAAAGGSAAEEALAECVAALERFPERVCAAEPDQP